MGKVEDGGRLLRLPDVIERVGMWKTMIYRLIEQKKFPAQVLLNSRSVAWRDSDIQAWIDARSPASESEAVLSVASPLPVPEGKRHRAALTLVQKGSEA